MSLEPNFLTTAIGSFPHTADFAALCQRLAATLDIPAWPQLPRRTGGLSKTPTGLVVAANVDNAHSGCARKTCQQVGLPRPT